MRRGNKTIVRNREGEGRKGERKVKEKTKERQIEKRREKKRMLEGK